MAIIKACFLFSPTSCAFAFGSTPLFHSVCSIRPWQYDPAMMDPADCSLSVGFWEEIIWIVESQWTECLELPMKEDREEVTCQLQGCILGFPWLMVSPTAWVLLTDLVAFRAPSLCFTARKTTICFQSLLLCFSLFLFPGQLCSSLPLHLYQCLRWE